MILMSKCSPCAALLTHKYAILDSSSGLYRMFLVSIDSLFLLLYSSLLLIYIFLLCTLLYSFFFFSLVSLWQHNSSSSLSLPLRIRLCRFCCVLFFTLSFSPSNLLSSLSCLSCTAFVVVRFFFLSVKYESILADVVVWLPFYTPFDGYIGYLWLSVYESLESYFFLDFFLMQHSLIKNIRRFL